MKIRKITRYLKVITFFLIIFLIISFVSGYFSKRVEKYLKQKAENEASNLISKSIKTAVLPSIDLDNLIKINKASNSEIESVFINTYQVNEIIARTIESINNDLEKIEENEKLNNLRLPVGIIISDVLFGDSNAGVNIKIVPVGSVKTDILTNYQTYGINNTLLEILIQVKVSFAIIIPLQKKEIEVTSKIPIVVQVIQGKVPTYYYHNTDSKFIPTPIG